MDELEQRIDLPQELKIETGQRVTILNNDKLEHDWYILKVDKDQIIIGKKVLPNSPPIETKITNQEQLESDQRKYGIYIGKEVMGDLTYYPQQGMEAWKIVGLFRFRPNEDIRALIGYVPQENGGADYAVSKCKEKGLGLVETKRMIREAGGVYRDIFLKDFEEHQEISKKKFIEKTARIESTASQLRGKTAGDIRSEVFSAALSSNKIDTILQSEFQMRVNALPLVLNPFPTDIIEALVYKTSLERKIETEKRSVEVINTEALADPMLSSLKVTNKFIIVVKYPELTAYYGLDGLRVALVWTSDEAQREYLDKKKLI